MTPDTPLDIQYFVSALASNGAITDEYAVQLWESLSRTDSLDYFANTLLQAFPPEIQGAWAAQFPAYIDYARQQAAAVSGNYNANAGMAMTEETVDYSTLPSLENISRFDVGEVRQRVLSLLSRLRSLKCSDLHLSAGSPPFVRRLLKIERIASYVLSAEDAEAVNFALLSDEQIANFKKEQDMSFALEVGRDRFRVCLMEQKDGIAGSYRLVPDRLMSLEELGFMRRDVETIKRLLDYNNGLILVTGPLGAGKTTTLASMINIINEKRQDHIISVEDPIEILQYSNNCQVSQREVGKHTNTYHSALKASLREDPDIIVIGEMHDLETIENAITASETGHLVIGTLHTGDAPNTLNRLLDVFPPNQQPQIRAMTAGSMRGIICQKLIPNGFGGLTMIYEIMLNTMSVSNIINEGNSFRLHSTMVTSTKQGMCTFDQCIYEKYAQGLITKEAALAEMRDETIIAQVKMLWAQNQQY